MAISSTTSYPTRTKEYAMTNTTTRPLHVIAQEIRADWAKPYFGAVPYLDAMAVLNTVTDTYGCEDGKTQVIYFLANANTWRGETARRIKAELKAMAGIKR
jgi:hypothetical protein